jgi:glutathione S-transferase
VKLLYQTHSPYARKVLVAAHEMGLHTDLIVEHHETSPTRRNDAVLALNPLGKVPVLICDDGEILFDSNVICEYLDGLHAGPKLIPQEPRPRFRALAMQALAQGIADAGIAARWETDRRPTHLRWPTMHAAQIQKIAAACDFLEHEMSRRNPPVPRRLAAPGIATVPAPAPNLGDIALATALSWIEFRGVYGFTEQSPNLSAWYQAMCARPSMQATALEGETQD